MSDLTTVGIVGGGPTADDLRERCTAAGLTVDLEAAQLILEASPDDDPDRAAAVISACEHGAPVAVATVTLSVTELAAATEDPERVCGLHVIPLLSPKSTGVAEVVRGLRTGPEAIAATTALVDAFELAPLEIDDRPGGLVHRILLPYLNDVVQAYDDGLASARDVDVALELGLGYPRGPLAVIDEIGAASVEAASRAAYDATADAHYAPAPLLTAMARAGARFHEDEKDA